MKSLSIALTPGAEDGVGPELLLKAIEQNSLDQINYVWCGDALSLERAAHNARLKLEFLGGQKCLLKSTTISYWAEIKESCLLKRQAGFLQKSVELALNNKIDAIVTGPIEKAALSCLPKKFPGQTEYFAHYLAKDEKPLMAFLGGPFMLSLLTSHIPLMKVSSHINKESVAQHLIAVADHAARISNLKPSQVKIAVLGINPHAGEQGLLGNEEQDVLIPVIKELSASLNISGPWPADGFFAYLPDTASRCKKDLPHVVVATYHDQGLIPYKLLAKGQAVNVTLGLRIPRVSPAHGTAKDIVGLNACSLSTSNAIKVAIDLARLSPLELD